MVYSAKVIVLYEKEKKSSILTFSFLFPLLYAFLLFNTQVVKCHVFLEVRIEIVF